MSDPFHPGVPPVPCQFIEVLCRDSRSFAFNGSGGRYTFRLRGNPYGRKPDDRC